MTNTTKFHDRLSRFAQAGPACGVRLVQVTALAGGNRYNADQVQFNTDGTTALWGGRPFLVTNLAEPASSGGQLSVGDQAVAIDVEGRWVVFVRSAQGASCVARVVAPTGASGYTVHEMVASGSGFIDKPGAADIHACNLAEATLGPGGAIDAGTRIILQEIPAGDGSGAIQYVFDHPVYAKYLG
jgi:hypothetical protein